MIRAIEDYAFKHNKSNIAFMQKWHFMRKEFLQNAAIRNGKTSDNLLFSITDDCCWH